MIRKPQIKRKKPENGDDTWRDMEWDEIRFGTRLYTSGKKVTQARLNVLSALSHFHKPVSIKELAASKPVKGHNITTLYRTLETLAVAGIVRKVMIDPSQSLYETNIDRPHHHHIVCTSCGLMEDIENCKIVLSQKELLADKFAEVTDHSLEFFGLCKNCYAK